MSLDTFGGIKTAVADWAFQGGGVTSTVVGTDFFPQVQSMMYYGDGPDVPALRIRAMKNETTVTPASGGTITISTDIGTNWLAFTEITPTQAGCDSLNYVDPWSFRKQTGLLQDLASPQAIYTIEGDMLYLAPASIGALLAKWYGKFAALSLDADTDWIITNAPQVYLNGCLMLACAYTDDSREPGFRAKFAASIRALNENDNRQRASGATMVARPGVVV